MFDIEKALEKMSNQELSDVSVITEITELNGEKYFVQTMIELKDGDYYDDDNDDDYDDVNDYDYEL